MNQRQMIVLVLGAIALLIVIFTAPQVYIFPSPRGEVRYDFPQFGGHQGSVDVPATMLRVGGVVLATFIIWFAFKDKKAN